MPVSEKAWLWGHGTEGASGVAHVGWGGPDHRGR